MPTNEKVKTVEKVKERYDRAAGLIFTEYRGLSVSQMQELRKSIKEKGGEIQVVKNTLFRIAAGEDAEKFEEAHTSGPTAIAFLYENESECAKALFDFKKGNEALVIKGGYIGGQLMEETEVKALSDLPPREVLIAQVIGTIAAPLSNLVGVVEALYAEPIRTIGAVADKAEEEGGVTPAEPKAEAEEPKAEETASEPETDTTADAAPAEEAKTESTEETKEQE